MSNGCYCGAQLKHFAKGLEECPSCKRLYSKGLLLVPWKKFRTRGTKARESVECLRCGGTTEYYIQSFRFQCEDQLCAYGWRNPDEQRMSHDEHRLREEMRNLRYRMVDVVDLEPLITEYSALKRRLETLGEETL